MATSPSFTSIADAATRLGVPIAWLKAEAEGERIPFLRAGRRLLFNVEAVQCILLSRAAATDDRKGVSDE